MTNLEITNAYVGSDQVAKLYLGGEAIWPSTPPEPVYSAMPLTFEIISGGTIVWYSQSNPKEIEYSKDNGVTWTSITSSTDTSFTVETGDKVQFRGRNLQYGIGGDGDTMCSSFIGGGTKESTAVFEVYGNIMSLLWPTDYETLQLTSDSCFRCLFNHFGSTTNQSLISAKHLILPDNVVDNCYRGMFLRCAGLVEAPEFPATTLASSCYRNMFQNCTGLEIAPELPATTLASSCYTAMFQGCSSLISAPVLPATTLANNCYFQMFYGCTSLTTAPELPATTLAERCYYAMFQNCSSLNYIKCLATDRTAANCTNNWVRGVAGSGTFVTPAGVTWTRGASGIPNGWTVIDA